MADNPHLVSIILPVYNAKNYLVYSLPAIKKSDYPCFELIVVDDNSTDGSIQLANKYADKVIRMKIRGGPAKARNAGALASKGDILFFIDSDVQVMPDTISQAVKILRTYPEIGAVFGSYDEDPYFRNFFSLYKNLFHHYVHQNANSKASTFWAGCGAIRKKIFLSVEGFPDIYSSPSIEDVELGYKLVQNNIQIRLLKDLQIKHLKRWNFISLVKTDIASRALPWTRLAVEKKLPYDLNFKLSDRISGVISCFFFLSLFFTLFWTPFLLIAFALAVSLVFINRKLYKFFLSKKGMPFAVFSAFFHWIYLFYSSVVFISLSPIFFIKKITRKNKSKPL